MTNQLRDRLAAELAVCEAATEGPWEWKRRKIGAPEEIVGVLKTSPLLWPDEPDAEFIATARTALPLALRALQAVMGLHYAATKWFPATNERVMQCRQCDVPFPCPTVKAIQEVYGDE